MSKTFENKVVLITGGTSGIGRATAVAFAKEGAIVVVSGRRKAEGAETVSLVEKAGGKGLFVQSDVSDEAQVKSLIDTTVKEFGRLDIAFNNAGIEGTPSPLVDATAEQYARVFDINVKGVFLCMKHEIPAMLKTGGGAIVNTSSVVGHVAMPNMGLTKTAALETAKQGVRINSVSPAVIETEMYDRFSASNPAGEKEQRAFLSALHPIGRIGKSEEVASAVLYLSSPGASFITGQDILIDGGFTAT